MLYAESSRPDLLGQTSIHMLGQGATVNAVTKPIGTVVSEIGNLVAAKRHYLAAPPDGGASKVYIAPWNVSYVRSNLPLAQTF